MTPVQTGAAERQRVEPGWSILDRFNPTEDALSLLSLLVLKDALSLWPELLGTCDVDARNASITRASSGARGRVLEPRNRHTKVDAWKEQSHSSASTARR